MLPSQKLRYRIKLRHVLNITTGNHYLSRSYISPPYFPMKPHSAISPISPPRSPRMYASRASSAFSPPRTSSVASFASTMTEAELERGEYDLQQRALTILNRLSRSDGSDLLDQNDEILSDLISKDISVQHDESPAVWSSKGAVLECWNRIREAKYEMRIKEAAVDQFQRKVWVVSELVRQEAMNENEPTVLVKERIDMMSFDWEGRLCATANSYRRRRRSSVDDED